MNESVISPRHEQLFAVEELVTFRNVYLVRAQTASYAAERVILDECEQYFQQHISSEVFNTTPVVEDMDVVKVLQSTEQPDMTLEQFTTARGEWLKNCVNEDPIK